MSIKGYPSQKKELSKLTNYTEDQSKNKAEFVTAQENYSNKVGLDVNNQGLARLHGVAKTAEANTVDIKRVLKNTGHGASKGDVIRFEASSANPYFEVLVLNVPDANTIILANSTPNNIVTGDSFFILRYVSQRFDQTGSIVASSGPVQFVLDGVDTQVTEDTVTPANSTPLPVSLIKSEQLDGSTANTSLVQVGGKDGSGNARTLLTNTDGSLQTSEKAYTSGSVVNGSLSTTVANSETAPAGAVGFIVQNESSNSNAIRFRVGGAASTTNGVFLEPGRDSGYIPIAATVSLCNVISSTQSYSILWVIK